MELNIKNILEIDYKNEPCVILDLSRSNTELFEVDLGNTKEFQNYIDKKIEENNAKFAIGRYGEDRVIYEHSNLFKEEERRTIHLGIDFWVKEGTKVFSPFNAKVHSYKNNSGIGNYGPTIILEHELGGNKINTLYGHLSLSSIKNISIGLSFNAGDVIGEVGDSNENGFWPTHLHFQIINTIAEYNGDFPGVCKPSQKEKYFKMCPHPKKILKINNLC